MTSERTSDACRQGACRCDASLSRRGFIKLGAAGIAWGAGTMPVMAGPFEDDNDYRRTIPIDKKLDPAWVQSLYQRGRKQTYRDPAALEHIGMPVGGLFAGTLYLSGDGRLWLWDIFNRDQEGILPRPAKRWPVQEIQERLLRHANRAGLNYVDPAVPSSPLKQGFSIRIGDVTRPLDATGFDNVTFDGRYPIGRVTYRDAAAPVEVVLEAFSPFIPLRVDDSSLPATIMSFCVKNTGETAVEAELVGHLQNAICLYSGAGAAGRRRNRLVSDERMTAVVCSAEAAEPGGGKAREDIVFEDFEKPVYDGWTAQGEAFGTGPVEMDKIPEYQGAVGGRGKRVVNSHASAPGDDVRQRDAQTGTLTSRPFVVQRNHINFLIGGGSHRGETCLNLIVDGKVVASATGRDNNRMGPGSFDTTGLAGKQAQLEIVDRHAGGWGNIGVDHIVFSDTPASASPTLHQQHDFGTMTLAVLSDVGDVRATAKADAQGRVVGPPQEEAVGSLQEQLIGTVGRCLALGPGESQTVSFVVAWHFPNFFARGVGGARVGHSYAARFDDAVDVAQYIAKHFERLAATTRLWVDTWYDSSLPFWLLDRTMANTSTLATTTCYRFQDGRFWAWEGIGCCPGTCTHVWHYAQAPGRLFPEIERIERQRVNFGIGMHEDGGIGMRTGLTSANHPADDGQCGRILGVLREHQMSADDTFLRQLWPKVKKALEFMIRHDGNADGILEGAQPNTLDAAWYGKIPFLSSLYLAALRAGEAMAREMGEQAFADRCLAIAEKGAVGMREMFNGEYFVQIEDPAHRDAIGVGSGCYIDQVFGQTWAHWANLGRLFDRDQQLTALRALWKYNFVPDVGAFRRQFQRGRWYAMAGDAGLLMCTWPRGGKDPHLAQHWQYGYFNECMTGFEWQAAAHMIWEGCDQPDLLQCGLAIARAIHDRYDASLRNPYNEIECSDHYARAMASYGLFQAVCGFHCHGPNGYLEFVPRLSPDDFRAAFTAADAWGSFAQRRSDRAQTATVEVRYGRLRLKTLAVAVGDRPPRTVTATLGERPVAATLQIEDRLARIELADEVALEAGQTLEIELA